MDLRTELLHPDTAGLSQGMPLSLGCLSCLGTRQARREEPQRRWGPHLHVPSLCPDVLPEDAISAFDTDPQPGGSEEETASDGQGLGRGSGGGLEKGLFCILIKAFKPH